MPKELRFGVKERVSAEGAILLTPSQQDLTELRERIKSSGAESIAISLLFSFANPDNESRVAAVLGKLGTADEGVRPYVDVLILPDSVFAS